MQLGRKKFQADPTVQFPRRRETDIEAAMRVEEIDMRRMDQEDNGPRYNRAMARKLGFRLRAFGQGREMDVPR